MNSGRDTIDQTQSIQGNERRALEIGKPFPPEDGSEVEEPVRGEATLRLDGFGEAEEIGRRSLQRRRRDELPRPCRRLTSPSSTRISIARVTVKRLTPNLLAN